jgi:hypothetical protein
MLERSKALLSALALQRRQAGFSARRREDVGGHLQPFDTKVKSGLNSAAVR